jgi:2-polyprenyl-6-methoxyphenol hydroxylase-like FAD-dependent oxidoreductase
VLNAIEGQRWLVSLFGGEGEHPPTDEEGFLGFARSLPDRTIYEVIKEARPLSPIYGNQHTANRLIHYDRCARWPGHLIALGDAVCAFNPVYGQGMAIAAFGAAALDDLLRERRHGDLAGLSRVFQRRLAGLIAPPWMMATSEDARWPGTKGHRVTPMTRLMHWYVDGVAMLLPESPRILRTFVEVVHMIEPPSRLAEPWLAARVLHRRARSALFPSAPG